MISPDRLERYKDFIDPERTGVPYDPRQGLERLMGVLSPDPKGIVLAAMGEDWYGTRSQLQYRVFSWLEELGLTPSIWPLTIRANWSYIELMDRNSGSLVDLGAVVKKIEQDPFGVLYQRSLPGAELALPLVQQAVEFVSKARENAEAQKRKEKQPHKYDSMWRTVGFVGSSTDQRRPLAVWSVIDFLVHNPGNHRQIDLQNQIKIPQGRLMNILATLSNSGIINYSSPETEKEGKKGRGWAVYRLVNPQSAVDLNHDKIYQDIRKTKKRFFDRSYLARVIDYIKEHPEGEYEHREIANQLKIGSSAAGHILSLLVDLDILERPEPGFKGGEVDSSAWANDLTFLFYDSVCAPAKEIADTLSPLPLRPWESRKLAIYLQNYNEERSMIGPKGGEDTRKLLLDVLYQDGGEMKLSYIVDTYNDQLERELKSSTIRNQLERLLKLGEIEQPRPGYYRLVKK